MDKFANLQDVVGQLPFLKTYSHLMLSFSLPDDDATKQEVTKQLQAASTKLIEAVPWLSAKVIEVPGGPGRSSSFQLERCDLWSPPSSIIRFRNCSSVSPSYDEIVKARGPSSMLSGDLLAPRTAFPESYHDSEQDPAPVLAFQANFISGGMLLDCAAQHNFIDMTGIEQCYNLLAAAIRGHEFSEEAISQANMDRRKLVPLLGAHEEMHDHKQFARPNADDMPPPPLEPSSPFSWRYFRFSSTHLAGLKRMASVLSSSDTVSYVSTNDALTAFCWQRVIAARLQRRGTPQTVAKFCRAVDARKVMGVPRGYMGDLVTIATSRMTFGELAEAPLATVAGVLRRDLMAVNQRDYVRSFATMIFNTADKANIVYGGKFNPDTDIGSSSWAQIGLAQVDFGHRLHRPSLIRRPNFVPLRSDVYLMPQTASGDIDALLCFNQHDFDGLMKDTLWNEYADYIG